MCSLPCHPGVLARPGLYSEQDDVGERRNEIEIDAGGRDEILFAWTDERRDTICIAAAAATKKKGKKTNQQTNLSPALVALLSRLSLLRLGHTLTPLLPLKLNRPQVMPLP